MKTQLRIASLSLLAAICLTLAAVPALAQQDLYDNGPVNGDTSAWQINFGYAVSDAAKVANVSRSNVKNNIVVWVEPGDTPTSIGWGLGTTPFSSNIASGTSPLTVTNSFVNQLRLQRGYRQLLDGDSQPERRQLLGHARKRDHGRRRSALLG